jgi:hypothetical protein
MQTNVFFPHGVSSFEQLATQGYVFVDKTPYLEKLELQKQKFVSFLRPRRFGKSLFLSMLEWYYDILYEDSLRSFLGNITSAKIPRRWLIATAYYFLILAG